MEVKACFGGALQTDWPYSRHFRNVLISIKKFLTQVRAQRRDIKV